MKARFSPLDFLAPLWCLLLPVLILLPISPSWAPVPGRDSGVYLYTAWRMLAGEAPYRQVWDHKPPGIFYIDALGLSLDDTSTWGVWALEGFALMIGAWLGWRLMREAFGPWPALVGTVAWLFSASVLLGGGNRPEEFALPLQWGALWLFWRLGGGVPTWRHILLGALGAGAFFLKQTEIGVWISIFAFWTLAAFRLPIGRLSRAAWGCGGVSLLLLLPILLRYAVPHWWNATFVYNGFYTGNAPLGAHAQAVSNGVKALTKTGFFPLALAGWIWILAQVRRWPGHEPYAPLLALALLGLPVELLMTSIASRFYNHYYLAWLPIGAILAAYAVFAVEQRAARPVLRAAVVALALLLVSVLPGRVLRGQLRAKGFLNPTMRTQLAVVRLIQNETQPTDEVLMWGAETRINFLARRRSPVRFTYQYPLYMPGYGTPDRVDSFRREIKLRRPILIVDTLTPRLRSDTTDFGARQQEFWQSAGAGQPPGYQAIGDWIGQRYAWQDNVGPEHWLIYRFKGAPRPSPLAPVR